MNASLFAALWTLGLAAVAAAFELNDLPFAMPLILLSTVWAYRDAERLEAERYEGFMARSSIRIALWISLLWIVGFPAYLFLRQRIVLGQATVKSGLGLGGHGAPPPRRPVPAEARPERALKLNRIAVGCAVVALAGMVIGLAWAQLSPGTNVSDLIHLCAGPAGLGVALSLRSWFLGGAGLRFAGAALAVPVALWSALVFGGSYVSQPVQELVFRGLPLPPDDLFPERAADLRRVLVLTQWLSNDGCPVYSGYYNDDADSPMSVTATLCSDEAAVASQFEAVVGAKAADELDADALRARGPSRAEFASTTCPAEPCRILIYRKSGDRLFEITGADVVTQRLEKGLWPPKN